MNARRGGGRWCRRSSPRRTAWRRSRRRRRARIASRSCSNALAVRATIGVRDAASAADEARGLRAVHHRHPLSMKIRSGRHVRQTSTASWPFAASRTSKPTDSSSLRSSTRFSRVSSTTRGCGAARPRRGRPRASRRAARTRSVAAGSSTSKRNVVPSPRRLATADVAAHQADELRLITSPRPVPSFAWRPLAVCTNGSKSVADLALGDARGRCPRPRSRAAARSTTRARRSLPVSVNFTALPSRLISTCRSFPSSPDDRRREGPARPRRRGESLGLGAHADHLLDAVEQPRGSNGRCSSAKLARLDLRDREHVVDQAEQVLAAAADDRRGSRDRRRSRAAARVHQLREAEHGVERRPQLVRHVRQEDALGAIGLHGARFGLLELERPLVHLRARGAPCGGGSAARAGGWRARSGRTRSARTRRSPTTAGTAAPAA